MKRLLFILMIGFITVLWAGKIDLNNATLDELEKLPITKDQAKDIYEYRQYISFFENIYDLREIPSIDQKTLLAIKPLVIITKSTDLDESEERREEIYYLIERLGSNEGTQEGFSDIWEDFLMTPQNINQMSFNDVLNIPNVSPVDAAAVLKRTADGDTITDYRNLRSSTGLSFYGASNLRHYVYYKDDTTSQKIFMNYQLKYEDKSYDEDTREMYREIFRDKNVALHDINHSYYGYFNMTDNQPAFTQKFRIRYQNNFKAGMINANQRGESSTIDFSNTDDLKAYAGYEGRFDLLGQNIVKAYVGNYRVTFGEGLVMENTDYYSSRKTGQGFSKRILGISPDISRSQEYALKGLAFSLENKYTSFAFWLSNDKKDAVVYDLNNDGVINSNDKDANGKYHLFSYVTSTTRFDNEDMEKAEIFFNESIASDIKLSSRKDVMDEKIIGGRWEISPVIGTHIGVSGYQTIYDNAYFRILPPDSIAAFLIRDASDYDKWNMPNAEINNFYTTLDYATNTAKDYRQIMGMDWRTVIGNTSIQGEYAELAINGNDLAIGDDPGAFLTSIYTQYENFNFLTLYRDYDLGFDNPYSRAFSEHERLDDTIIDKNNYCMTNPLLGDLFLNSAQAQAERGIYFETRYRFNKKFTLNRTYLDIWERKSDSRRSVRFQGDLEYRPINELSFRLKYKNQTNRYDDFDNRGVSKTSEVSGITTVYLSNRDRIQTEYRYTKVWGPPYPYLSNDPVPGDDTIAQSMTTMLGDFLRIDFTHNINDRLRFRTGLGYWNGHGVSHWDFEDMEIDFMGEQGLKYWVLLQNKIANNLYLSMKFRAKNYKTHELIMRTWSNDEINNEAVYYKRVAKDDYGVRLQLEWRY